MAEIGSAARALGYAGLLPQAIALVLVLHGGPPAWTALAISYSYAALILSFLGGVWWGAALARPAAPAWHFAVAVLPSLLGLAGWFPWMLGWTWPRPELIAIGAAILASPLVDRALGGGTPGWMRLRTHLSLGLGGLTLAIAFAG